MERQGKGAIVNIASVSGIRWLGVPYISYAATKAAVIQFTRVLLSNTLALASGRTRSCQA
jgi:NAD(P)-dependent dehydrogenase (short-subunit alcohol dehydrogenase family)